MGRVRVSSAIPDTASMKSIRFRLGSVCWAVPGPWFSLPYLGAVLLGFRLRGPLNLWLGQVRLCLVVGFGPAVRLFLFCAASACGRGLFAGCGVGSKLALKCMLPKGGLLLAWCVEVTLGCCLDARVCL